MYRTGLFLLSTPKLAARIIPFLLIFVVSAVAQSDLRSTVYGKPKPKTISTPVTKKKKTTTASTKTAPPKTVPPKATAVTVTKPTPTPARQVRKKTTVKLIPVTFTAKESAVEIYLNYKNIGKTDTSFQFAKNIAPGEYHLTAKNKLKVLVSKNITINAEQTAFDLFEKPPPVLKVVETKVEETPKPVEKSETEIEKELSEKAKGIFETYENPTTTDSVTADDWQIVLQASPFGHYMGNTAVQSEAQRWFASGQIEFAKKEYLNALTAYVKATEFLPNWAFPYYELGNTYLAKNQLTDAIKMYQKALQANNRLGMVYKKLGDAQRLSGKEIEALAAYELASQFGYRTYETRFFIATLRLENKQLDKGIEELESLAQESPKVELFIKIGEAYEKLKRDLPAIANYQKAIALDPNAIQAHYRIGRVYINRREYALAKESLEKAIALDPAGKNLDVKDAQKKLREIAVKSNPNNR